VTKLRISIVQYLNTAPLIWGFHQRQRSAANTICPSRSPRSAPNSCGTGEADIAIIPAIEYARSPNLEILPELSIASKKMVRSLLLVSKAPIGQFKSVALDASSRSTQALTRILCSSIGKSVQNSSRCRRTWKNHAKEGRRRLLIGDPALRLSLRMEPFSNRVADHGSRVAR